VEWSRPDDAADDKIDLHWRETGGPPAPRAKRRGFGLKLIERETTYNLQGKAEVTFGPGGIEARIAFGLEDS
jgi:two-component sensor histidine kinase